MLVCYGELECRHAVQVVRWVNLLEQRVECRLCASEVAVDGHAFTLEELLEMAFVG